MVRRTSVGSGGNWLAGNTEMVRLIHSMDWSSTPLGSLAGWPQSLRIIVNTVLAGSFPMAVLWGRDLTLIYNDGYAKIAAGKHPWALGRSVREVWPEVWEFSRPIFERVMDRGETVHLEDQLFGIARGARAARAARAGSATRVEDAWFTLSYSPIRNEQGGIGGTLVTLIETTQRVQLEQQLKQERQTLRSQMAATVQSLPDELWIIDREGRIVLVNDAVKTHLGVSPDHWEDIYMALGELEVSLPDGTPRPADQAPLARALRGEVLRREMEIIRNLATGELRWREVSAAPTHDSEGNVTGAVLVVRDITERKRMEETLLAIGRRSQRAKETLHITQEELSAQNAALAAARALAESEQERYFDLFDSAPDGYVVTDADGTILEANRAATAMLGTVRGRLQGVALCQYVLPEQQEWFRGALSRLAKEGGGAVLDLRVGPSVHGPWIDAAINASATSSHCVPPPPIRFAGRCVM